MASRGEGVNDGNKRKANKWGPVITYGRLAQFLLSVWEMQPCACGLGRECIHACTDVVWITISHKRGAARPQPCSGMNEWKWIHFRLCLTIKSAIPWPLLHNNTSCFSRHVQALYLILVTCWWWFMSHCGLGTGVYANYGNCGLWLPCVCCKSYTPFLIINRREINLWRRDIRTL